MEVKLLLLLILLSKCVTGDEVSCTTNFCDDNANKCPTNKCNIFNTTILPFPGPCSCCEYCLTNLVENESCTKGSPDNPLPTVICGSGLSCNEDSVCDIVQTDCIDEIEVFDEKKLNGSLGHLELRPSCDEIGDYKPYVCIPGEICFCVDEQGNRIFGEIPYTNQPEYHLRCGCSRYENKAKKNFERKLNPKERFRCQSNGDFDLLQCIEDDCLCVDAEDGSPTYPNARTVKLSELSQKTLPCFNNNTHKTNYYFLDCEDELIMKLDEIKTLKEEFDVLGSELHNCQLDGKYASVQGNKTHQYCTDPDGNLLEDFIVAKQSDLAEEMNCKCARARTIIRSEELPSCLSNGNYNPMQCRRGLCRCVDENGKQIEKEVDYEQQTTLSCSSNK